MAYQINRTNGQLLISLVDGTADGPQINPGFNVADINLFGKNFENFGELQNENFLKLLENFANDTPPSKPLSGELWYDTAASKLKIYTGNRWIPVVPVTSSAGEPTVYNQGDLWWDETDGQFKVWDNGEWYVIGPAYKRSFGLSGAIPDVVYDVAGNPHIVVKMYSEDRIISIFSYDTAFTPNVSIPGFTSISPGNQMSTVHGGKFTGTATNSDQLGGVVPENYARTDIDESFSGDVSFGNDSLRIQTVGSHVRVANTNFNGNVEFYTNSNGNQIKVAQINGASGSIQADELPVTGPDLTNKTYVDAVVDNAVAPLASLTQLQQTDTDLRSFVNQLIPIGTVTMWYGTPETVPTGWAICNGTNGTPDLRDRVPVGAGAAYELGDTGGDVSVILSESQLPIHTHVITVAPESLPHTHGFDTSTILPDHIHEFTTGPESESHRHDFETNTVSVQHSHSGGTNSVAAAHSHGYRGFTHPGGSHNHPYRDRYYIESSIFNALPFVERVPGNNYNHRTGSARTDNDNVNFLYYDTETSNAGIHQHEYSGVTDSEEARHSHTVTVGLMSTSPEHNHSGRTDITTNTHNHAGSTGAAGGATVQVGGVTASANPVHAHNAIASVTGGNQPIDLRQPYHALYYIMRVSYSQ